MGKVFISYRRDDSLDITARIYDRLVSHLGAHNLFMDLDSVPLGRDFRQVLQESILASNVVLVVIGRQWLNFRDAQSVRRLDHPDDLVRFEVATALSRAIPVIPVLTQGTLIPAVGDLPESISELAYRNGIEVRSDLHFSHDMDALIERLGPLLDAGLHRLGAQDTPALASGADGEIPIQLPPSLAELGYDLQALDGQYVITPPLCEAPAGPFIMGSNPIRDSGAHEDEEPQHQVHVPAFQISRYPVTVIEYACFLRATGRSAPRSAYNHLQWQQQLFRLDHPVVNVNWRETMAYAAWLGERTGLAWRLPSEAEWEKAARWDPTTHTARIYPWGDAFDPDRCNTSEGARGRTSPVGSYPAGASPCGAMDMTGNVWEWTRSIYRPYPFGSHDTARSEQDLQNPALRGGSWGSDARGARSAFRYDNDPNNANNSIGFRLIVQTPAD